MAQTRANTQGIFNGFENVEYILLHIDLFPKTTTNKPKVSFDISSTESKRYGRDKCTYVNLRWCNRDDFTKLSSEAKNEL